MRIEQQGEPRYSVLRAGVAWLALTVVAYVAAVWLGLSGPAAVWAGGVAGAVGVRAGWYRTKPRRI